MIKGRGDHKQLACGLTQDYTIIQRKKFKNIFTSTRKRAKNSQKRGISTLF